MSFWGGNRRAFEKIAIGVDEVLKMMLNWLRASTFGSNVAELEEECTNAWIGTLLKNN